MDGRRKAAKLEVHVSWLSRAHARGRRVRRRGDDCARPALSRARRRCGNDEDVAHRILPVHSGRDERLRRVDQPRHRYGE